jgi:acylphosphatase
MSSAIRRVRIRVRGRVQGVFFRAETQKKARGLGLTGWVQNEPDGAVLLEAQGPSHLLDQLEVWVREGPPMAMVTGADAEARPVVDGEPTFQVRH